MQKYLSMNNFIILPPVSTPLFHDFITSKLYKLCLVDNATTMANQKQDITSYFQFYDLFTSSHHEVLSLNKYMH